MVWGRQSLSTKKRSDFDLDMRWHRGHGFCRGCALVEHGGVGHLHTREVGDHGLEIDQGFQTTLGNLWLIGSIGGVPGGVFQDIALHYIGGNGVVITLTNKAAEDFVVLGASPQFGQCLSFATAINYIQGLVMAMASGTT